MKGKNLFGKAFCGTFGSVIISLLFICQDGLIAAMNRDAAPSVQTFQLLVNDESGLDEQWPVIGGLPFPEGALKDASQIRIVDAVAQEVPAQIDVVSTWRDGSIRWAHAALNAGPQEEYRVEFGPGVERTLPENPMRIERDDDGGLMVDTGAAVYQFSADSILPNRAEVNGVAVLDNSGEGAYLIDNLGRTARVAGAEAEVETELLNQGPMRSVILREGWYVTEEGSRIARARVWFYLTAGSPYMKISHSLVLTEDTTGLWVRDYGLDFTTPAGPQKVAFALGESDAVFTPRVREVDYEVMETNFRDGGEMYLYQDSYPHFREKDYRAVAGWSSGNRLDTVADGDWAVHSFWMDEWLGANDVSGDWGHADYGEHSLTVVTPHLAQRFPKEIAFGPENARVALWSSRGGRELDFRMSTLVTEYWQDWTELAPGGPASLVDMPSNAQGMARTHDIWLLPGGHGQKPASVSKLAETASYPPLLLADPHWTASTGAFDWPFHPRDPENFPVEEELIEAFWHGFMDNVHQRQPYIGGFIEWGRNPTMRGLSFFRLHSGTYNLPLHIWGAYARSGDRSMFNYGTRYNQYVSDVRMTHWTAGSKFEGGHAVIGFMNISNAPPIYWGDRSSLMRGPSYVVVAMHSFINEYYLTGNEHMKKVVDSYGRAYKERWDPEALPEFIGSSDGAFHHVRELVALYNFTGDEEYADMARTWVRNIVDFDTPNALTDEIRFGNLYKVPRNIFWLLLYYHATGDDMAKDAALQALDYKYRFSRIPLAAGSQDYAGVLYGMAYELTGDRRYLRVIDYQHRVGLARYRILNGLSTGILGNRFPMINLPGLLASLADVDEPVETFPILQRYSRPAPSKIIFRKANHDAPVHFKATVWMESDDVEPEVRIIPHRLTDDTSSEYINDVKWNSEQAFMSSYAARQNPHKYSMEITMPAEAVTGLYFLDIPDSAAIRILESNTPEIAVYGPQGVEIQRDVQPNYFHVDRGLESLDLFLSVPMQVRRPDGSIALEDSEDHIGFQSIPVEGHGGAWSLVSHRPDSIVRFLNVEPLVSRSPELMVKDAGLEPEERFEPPGTTTGFVEAPEGRALHLPGGNRLSFERGRQAGDRYEHFPAIEGTIEFWFRPNWSSLELPYTAGANFHDKYFVRAGSHDLQFRRGRRRATSPEYYSMNLWVRGEKDVDSGFDINAGFTGRYRFEAGEWYHIAASWRIEDGEIGNEGEYTVYVNGSEIERDDYGRRAWPYYPGGPGLGDKPLIVREPMESVFVGPIDGTIARLRISDVVRYENDFVPDWKSGGLDDDTVVFFGLNGEFVGTKPEGSGIDLNASPQ